MKRWLVLLTLLLVPVMAQQPFGLSVPPKPPKHVLDQARLFVVETDRLEAMEARIAEFSGRTGYELQVAFFDSLIGVDLPEKVVLLQEEWLGDGPGLVLVVIADSGEWQIGWASTPDVRTEGGGLVPVLDERDLAPQDQIGVVQALRDLPRMSAGSIEGAEELVGTLLSSLEPSFRAESAKTGQRMRFWVLGIGLLAGLMLLAMLAVTWTRRLDAKRRDLLVFPEVVVGQRLGASSGGGKISSRSFSRSPGRDA